jgi:hypothetical protein
MSNYYKFIDILDTKEYIDYFLNDFIKEHNFIELITKQVNKTYIVYPIHEYYNPLTAKLSRELTRKYKFPPISHFILFYHTGNQSIHADGSAVSRWCSFNLPLIGWEGTRMNFYSAKPDVVSRNAESRYYHKDDVVYQDHFDCTNNWVLVHSGLPHHVCGMTPEKPRITLVNRFFGNPTFETLTSLINKTSI